MLLQIVTVTTKFSKTPKKKKLQITEKQLGMLIWRRINSSLHYGRNMER